MFRLPAQTHTEDGDWRRVGFEVEFTGLTLARAVEVAENTLGGERREEDAAHCVLAVPGAGDFAIEIDWAFLKRQAAEQDGSGEGWVELLSLAAERVVPLEVVAPPLPLKALDRLLEPLVAALRAAGAAGTRDTVIAAYGVHINTEAPDLGSTTLWRYLASFALLQWWLVDAHAVDLARRVSPYVDLYPESYTRELCEQGPPAATEKLLADYLKHNPTRNRALDLLPLLSVLDEAAVQAAVNDDRVKARPAFHYRLPNCLIDDPDWSLASAWEGWRVVDDLAQRPGDLDALAAAYLERWRPLLGVDRAGWCADLEPWLHDRALV
ncbi:MAG TPA: amidoligase family protein [Pseudohaliea sp.]|nr:amidoligase family protein [Pseudohaliea sp.]